MKRIIKENWFKIVISLTLLAIAISVAYYIFLFLPKKDAAILEEQKQEADAQLQQEKAQQTVDQQTAEAKAEQDKQATDQQAAQAQTAQGQQAAAAKQAADKQKQLDNCLTVANDLKLWAIKHNVDISNPALEQQWQDAVYQCYHQSPQ